jgi:hypothetical protein
MANGTPYHMNNCRMCRNFLPAYDPSKKKAR